METTWGGACHDLSLSFTLESPRPYPKPSVRIDSDGDLVCVKWFLTVALTGISLLTSDVEHHVMSLLVTELFWRLFKSLLILNWVVCLLLLDLLEFFIYCGYKSFVICVLQVCYFSLSLIFSFLLSGEQNSLTFDQIQTSTFSFMLCVLVSSIFASPKVAEMFSDGRYVHF